MIADSRQDGGFSLLEVVITLVIAALLGSMLYAYFNASLNQGALPIERLQVAYDLNSVVENLTSDYKAFYGRESAPRWRPGEGYALGARVRRASGTFGRLFRCVQDGNSGTSEPAWINTPGAVIADGSASWQVEPGELDEMISRLLTTREGTLSGTDSIVRDFGFYGHYGVESLRFIRFAGDQESGIGTGDPRNLLKVILVSAAGERQVLLFTTSY